MGAERGVSDSVQSMGESAVWPVDETTMHPASTAQTLCFSRGSTLDVAFEGSYCRCLPLNLPALLSPAADLGIMNVCHFPLLSLSPFFFFY